MADRKLEALVRLIDKRIALARAGSDSMIEQGEVSSVSGSAGSVPTCTIDGDDAAEVFEPYGLAGQASSGDALIFAPGADVDNLTALLSSVAGRPATEPGDKALWSAAGHVIYLDNDGSLTVTSKDGAIIELPNTGGVVVTAASLADITLNVDVGHSVNAGGPAATALVKDAENTAKMNAAFAAGIAFVGTPGDPAGTNAGAAFAAAFAAYSGAPSAATLKAKGE